MFSTSAGPFLLSYSFCEYEWIDDGILCVIYTDIHIDCCVDQ